MSESQTFSPRAVAWGIAASIIALAGFIVLATYAPDFRSSPPGAATADAKGGNGYAGIVKLLELAGEDVELRSIPATDADLLVVPIDEGFDVDRLTELAQLRRFKSTLFVLPKWQVARYPRKPGFVRKVGPIDRKRLSEFAEALDAPLPTEGDGAAAQRPIAVKGQPHWMLVDADRLNNAGLAKRADAVAAVALLRGLKTDPQGAILFDLSLARAPVSRSLGKLMLEPPFLALTLSLLFAALLAFLSGLGRFGEAARPERVLRFGKRALADATARLMRRGGKIGGLGDHYADIVEMRAASRLRAPANLHGDALLEWLDRRDEEATQGFSAKLAALRAASNEPSMLAASDDLNRWIKGKTREN